MIKVFLVDDEIAIREGVRNSFPWGESGYTLAGEAPDGEIALPMIRDENPDILITDIRMPFMDGIQLCEEVRRTMPWIGIVILSGYDDFSYARKAISLGVREYLLKPVNATEMREALDRVTRSMQEERQQRENTAALRSRLRQENRFVKDKLLSTLFTDDLDEQSASMMQQQLRTMGISLFAPCYSVLDISFEAEASRDVVMDLLYDLADHSGGSAQVCSCRTGARAVILGDSEVDTEDRAYSFSSSVLHGLDSCGAGNVLITVGESVSKLSELPEAMRSARHIRHLCLNKEKADGRRVIGLREMDDQPEQRQNMDIRPLHEQLQYTTPDEFSGVFARYVSSLDAGSIHTSVARDYLRVEALLTAARIVNEAGGDPEQILCVSDYEASMHPEDGDDLSGAQELLRKAVAYRDENATLHVSPGVMKARYYMAQHFQEPGLMLQDVAGYAGMSNSRFSTVFAQETGYTFTEYLTELRMSKARELLRATDQRSSQIAEAVGYNDPHYFSYTFRKSTGMSPSEYRKTQNEN